MEEEAQTNFSLMASAMIAEEEGSFTLSPALAAPCILPTTPDLETPDYVEELLVPIYQARVEPRSPNSDDKNPFLSHGEGGGDAGLQQHLTDLPTDEPHQVATTPSEHAPKLVEQTVNYSRESSRILPVYHSHERPASCPTFDREALFPPLNSPGCVVTIHNLPIDISMRDILARIRGGDIRTASLVKLKNAVCAVITFKEARSAQLFVHASKSFNDEIWTFKGQDEESESRTAQIAYVPILNTDKLFNDPVDIPLAPRFSMELDLATRCIAITKCSFEVIEEIWKAFRLSEQLRSPHYTNQFEDIWLGDFQRGRGGRIEYATLHIWYTNTNMAVGARQRAYGRHWAVNMHFEADPCNDTPSVLFFRPSEDAGFAWHSNPNHSLLNVYRAGCIGELFRTWGDISKAVKAAYETPSQSQGQRKLLPSEDMAERRAAALTNGGFDPVTLMCFNTQDYDSDDEGGRGPPLLNTREMKSLQATARSLELSPRNACLTILETLAARAPSTYIYSPGTSYETSAVEATLEDESASPDGIHQNFDEVACVESSSSPASHSSEIDGSEDVAENDPKKDLKDADDKFANMRKALTDPTDFYSVSMAEFMACNDQQRKAMGTMFYIPPEGHNSLKRYRWGDEILF